MSDVYLQTLARDATEVQRINSQFHIVTDCLGWTIHPSIAAKLPASPAIADFATGTGLFLSTLAADLPPTARLDGFDMSGAMFPTASAGRPPNVHLSVLNAKDPLPRELHGSYDLINVRYIIAGIEPAEWEPLLRNLLLGLKDGGAIQWTEPAVSRAEILRGRADSSTAAFAFLKSTFVNLAVERFESGWSTLPGLMKQAGLSSVIEDVVSCDRVPEARRALADNSLVAYVGGVRRMAALGKLGDLDAKEIDGLEAEAWREIETGAYAQYTIHTAIGFKP